MICPTCNRDGWEPSGFAETLSATLATRKITLRDAAKEIGIQFTLLGRAASGENVPTVGTLYRICKWADMDIEKVAKEIATRSDIQAALEK